jgi:SNF2 family DNA or RNA helicase
VPCQVRGPFLVLAPLSTLAHWQREFETWTEMNAVVYHGSFESRERIRASEFHFADQATNQATRGQYKFHALITSYEVVKQDLDHLRKVPWRYMVID